MSALPRPLPQQPEPAPEPARVYEFPDRKRFRLEPPLPESGPCGMAGTIGGPLADYECVHGRLPGDRTPPCGCWGAK